MIQHTVQQGEHISLLAHRYHFLDYRLIWDHGANADLRQRRESPDVLLPGDIVAIPDKGEKTVSAVDAKVHTFQVKRPTLMLRIAIRDYFDEAIANVPCVLEVDDTPTTLMSDASGLIERRITPVASNARLQVLDSEVEIRVGHLDPVDEESGQIARLNNLGYGAGPIEKVDSALLQSAIEEFQCDQKIHGATGKVTGVCDSRTQARLKAVHGS